MKYFIVIVLTINFFSIYSYAEEESSSTPLKKLTKMMENLDLVSKEDLENYTCEDFFTDYRNAHAIEEGERYPQLYNAVELEQKMEDPWFKAKSDFYQFISTCSQWYASCDSYSHPFNLSQKYFYLLDSLFEEKPQVFNGTMFYNMVRNLPETLSIQQKKDILDLTLVFLFGKKITEIKSCDKYLDYEEYNEALSIVADVYVNTNPDEKLIKKTNDRKKVKQDYLKLFNSSNIKHFCLSELISPYVDFALKCAKQAKVVEQILTYEYQDIRTKLDDKFFALSDTNTCDKILQKVYALIYPDQREHKVALRLLKDSKVIVLNGVGYYADNWTAEDLDRVEQTLNQFSQKFRSEFSLYRIIKYLETPGMGAGWYYVTLNYIGHIGSTNPHTILHEAVHVWDYHNDFCYGTELGSQWNKLCEFQTLKFKDPLNLSDSDVFLRYTTKRQCRKYASCNPRECLAETASLMLTNEYEMDSIDPEIVEFIKKNLY